MANTRAIDAKKYAKGAATDRIIDYLRDKADILKIAKINGQPLYDHPTGNIEVADPNMKPTFDEDLILTADVGVHKMPKEGFISLPTTGKTTEQVMKILFTKEELPVITPPSMALVLTNAGAVEVGTTVTPAYTSSFNPGSYTYGPETGITPTEWAISDKLSNVGTTQNGTLPALKVIEDTNYTISGRCRYTEGAIPKNNIGKNVENLRIPSGVTPEVTAAGKITGYRNCFYGTVTAKNPNTNTIIRGLNKSNRGLSKGGKMSISIPIGAMRVIFAYPASLGTASSVKDVNGMNAEIISSFKSETIKVEGASAYTPIDYKVYYLDYATPNNKTNTYTVTI